MQQPCHLVGGIRLPSVPTVRGHAVPVARVCVIMLIPAGSRCLGNAPNAAHVHAAFQTVVLRCVSLSIHGSVSGCAVRAETCVCCFRLSLLATCLLFRLRTSARWWIFKRASCGSPTSASRILFPNQCVRISRSVCLDVFVANVAPGAPPWSPPAMLDGRSRLGHLWLR